MLNLISHEQDIDGICLYDKDSCEAKYQLLIHKRESAGIKHFNDSEHFIEYSNDMDNVNKSIHKYNHNKKRKLLIVFGDIITDMLSNKKRNPVVTLNYLLAEEN